MLITITMTLSAKVKKCSKHKMVRLAIESCAVRALALSTMLRYLIMLADIRSGSAKLLIDLNFGE